MRQPYFPEQEHGIYRVLAAEARANRPAGAKRGGLHLEFRENSSRDVLETRPDAQDNGAMATVEGPAVEKLLLAIAFAARKHSHQRRRDSRQSPFINHPIAVAQTLAHVGKVEDVTMLQAAILHDVLEATDATPADLFERFGNDVCTLVKEVTDDKTLSRIERQQRHLSRAQGASPAAKQILIADKICNVMALSLTDPPNWPAERKTKYILWADRVVAVCRGCNPALEDHFDKVFAQRRTMFLQG